MRSRGDPVASTRPCVHQRDSIAAGRLIHEMGRNENRDPLIAREVDEEFPELIPSERIDTRCRLVQDQQLWLVHDGDGKRKPLANAERKRKRLLIEIWAKTELTGELVNASGRSIAGQVKQPRVEIEVLSHRELSIERE